MKKANILRQQIHKLLNGSLTYFEFEKQFYKYFIKNVFDKDLTEEQMNYFSIIQEQFEWTVENPLKEDKHYGYMDWQQFIRFVKGVTDIFNRTGKLNYEEADDIRVNINKSSTS